MIITSEHLDLDGGKWTAKLLDLRTLKHLVTSWQKGFDGKGWSNLYWNNNDQPRIVSRWGNDTAPYRDLSAKMLATCLHFLCGTPSIYQGEEIGKQKIEASGIDISRHRIYLTLYFFIFEFNSREKYHGIFFYNIN
jgi:oligo-1,6-glucosidase